MVCGTEISLICESNALTRRRNLAELYPYVLIFFCHESKTHWLGLQVPRGSLYYLPQTSCTSWEIRQNIMKFPYMCASSYIDNPKKKLINLYKPGNFMPRRRRFHPHRSRAGNPYLAICHVWVVLRDTSARHLEVAEGRWVVTSKMVVSQWNPTFWVTFFFKWKVRNGTKYGS